MAPELTAKEQLVLGNIKKVHQIWDNTANRLVYITISLGLLIIVPSVLVSVYTATDLLSRQQLKVLACTSTISLTLLTAFNIVGKGNNARKAWRVLNAGIYNYESGIWTMTELIRSYEEGERIMCDVDFSYGMAPPKPAKNTERAPQAP